MRFPWESARSGRALRRRAPRGAAQWLRYYQQLRRLPRSTRWLLLLVVIGGGGGYYALELHWREGHAYAGVPQVQQWHNWQTWHRVLRNEGYMVGYSGLRRNPLWVSYRLEATPHGPTGSRPSRFTQDARILLPWWQVSHDDYTGSGYDRGHLAPNYAMARVHGRDAQLASFLMTNISPQTPNLNRRVWQRIEQSAMDHFVQIKGEVWVTTGPVFSAEPKYLESGVEIPEAFYKIFVAPPQGERPLKSLAFLVPQTVRGDEPLAQFLVSIREIEERTGLNFLHRLPHEQQEQLETTIHPAPWRLEEVSQRAALY